MIQQHIFRSVVWWAGLGISAQSFFAAAPVNAATVSAGVNTSQPQVIERNKYREGVLLVKYKSGADNEARINGSRGITNLRRHGRVKFEPLVRRAQSERREDERWRVVSLPGGIAVEEGKKAFDGDTDVEAVEPDYALAPGYIPNDPEFAQLWNLDRVQAPAAWDVQRGSSRVVVAVIDTGIDYYHEDLNASMWTNGGEKPDNGIDDDNNGFVDDFYGYDFAHDDGWPADDHGHGTHVAGTVSAIANNGKLVAGLAGNVRVMAVKFLDDTGAGWVSSAVRAINYAVDRGAKVINASWGSTDYSFTLYDAIKRAGSKNVLFVASAGNLASDSDRIPSFPAAYDLDNIVSVAATDQLDNLTGFSNYGAKTVDLAAPGLYVYSTVPRSGCTGLYWNRWALGMCNEAGFTYASGTSMAAPHVAGAAALLLTRYATLSLADVKKTLIEKSTPVSYLTGKMVSGGRLDVSAVVRASFVAPYDAMIVADTRQVLTPGAASYPVQIQITSVNGFTSALTLSVTTADPRLTASLATSSFTLAANTSKTVQLTLKTAGNLPRGNYPVMVTALASGGRRIATQVMVTHKAPDFELKLDSDQTNLVVGESKQIPVTVTSAEGFTGYVDLKTTNLPAGITAMFTPSRVTVPRGGSVLAMWQLTSSATAPVRELNAFVQATDGNTYHAQKHAISSLANGVDLIVSDIESRENKLNVGGAYPIYVAIKNQGTQPLTYSAQFGIYLSTDSTLTADDLRLFSSIPIGGLGQISNGGIVDGDWSVTIPTSVVPGRYFLGAIADIAVDSQGVSEINVNNNVSTLIPVDIVTGVDLSLANLVSDPAAAFSTGQSVTLSDSLRNNGTNRTRLVSGRPIEIKYYLSKDAIITSSDVFVTSRTWSYDLAAGSSLDNRMEVLIPSSRLTSGAYYLGAMVDQDNVIAESNEGNNTLLGSKVTLTHNVDLSLVNVTAPARQTLWTYLRVTADISNAGSSPVVGAKASFYLSSDTTVDTSDLVVGGLEISGAIPAYSKQAISVDKLLEAPLKAGRYNLIAVVDKDQLISETNESNNRVVKTIDIVNDLDIELVKATPSLTRFTAADTVKMDTVLYNRSASQTMNTRVSIYLSKLSKFDTSAVELPYSVSTAQGINPGESRAVSLNAWITSDNPAGRYYMFVIAATDHDINPANNMKTVAVDFSN